MKATWWAQATGAVTYARCELPARYLPGKTLQFQMPDLAPGPDGPHFPRQEGKAAIWCFPGNATRGRMMAWMQEIGLKALVEVDDLYLVQVRQIPGTTGRPWRKGFDKVDDSHSVAAHTRIAGFADGVICATPQLANEYRSVNKNVFVCLNTVDPVDWQFEKPADGVFRVGFAGSLSHWIDIPLILDGLRWAAKQPDVEVVWIGTAPQGLDFPTRSIAWTDTIEEYRKNLFQLDVGLCPLKPNRWANCKSDIKALEYSMAGALPIVSRVEPYRQWVKHDSPALTADNKSEFERHVKWCVNNKEEVMTLAAACKQKVLDERTIEKNVWLWEEAIAEKTSP